MEESDEIKSLSPTFDLITNDLVNKWEEKLLKNDHQKARLITEDINFDDYNLSYFNEQTIKNDTHRTRVRERFNYSDFESVLQKVLIYFCKLNNIEYKQGLNEILGPFLLLKIKLPKLTLPRIYNIFTLFIDYFLPNYFYETELFSFRNSISLVTLLLKFHSPKLYLLFKNNKITAEMYSINWILTTFANKNSLEITYALWDTLLEENDQLFVHLMIISFLEYNQKKFFETDGSSIPVLFSKIQISTKEELNQIVEEARNLRKHTPLSFRILAHNLEIFKSRTIKLKDAYEKYSPEQMLSLPIFPEELLCNLYKSKDKILCPNEQCGNFFMLKKNTDESDVNKTQTFCPICKISNIFNDIKYIVIDLRNKNDSQTKENIINEGSLSFINTEILTQTNLNKINVEDLFLQQVIKHKLENTHIILMTNDTDNFDDYEYDFQENQTKYKKDKLIDILYSTVCDITKSFDEQKNKKGNLIENGYKHISYVYGGYKSLHDLCLKYNIDILEHKSNTCYLCINKNDDDEINNNEPSYKIVKKIKDYNINLVRKFSDSLSNQSNEGENDERKNSIDDSTIKVIEEIPVIEMNNFLNDSSNKIYHCLLVWKNMNDLNEKIIFIVFKELIQIFKMNVKKEGIFFDIIEKIEFQNIKDLKRDKNIFNLYYKKGDKNNDIKIDTFTDNDGESFNKVINDILSQNKTNLGK